MEYVIYVTDTETTGLDCVKNDIIELSCFRLNIDMDKHCLVDGEQKTWLMKPFNLNDINDDSLRVNGHKREDILHQTHDGRTKYLDPVKTSIDIENWILEDGVTSSQRILTGQNISFDKNFLEQHWNKAKSPDSFPFGRRVLDTMIIEFFLDLCKGTMSEGYSLNNIIKKYGIKNDKSHTAAADVKATKEVLLKQFDFFKSKLK